MSVCGKIIEKRLNTKLMISITQPEDAHYNHCVSPSVWHYQLVKMLITLEPHGIL